MHGHCVYSLPHSPPFLTSLPPPLTSPHLTSPHLTSPHLTSPHLTSPHSLTHVKHGATRSTEQCARKQLRARSTLALQQRLSCVRPQGLLSLVLRSSSCLSCYIHVTACVLPLSFSGDVSLVFRKNVSTRALRRVRDRAPTRRTRAYEPLVSGSSRYDVCLARGVLRNLFTWETRSGTFAVFFVNA